MLTMTAVSAFDLPAGIKLKYLAEGGANVVYRIISPKRVTTTTDKTTPSTGTENLASAGLLQGKLLRLRKDVQYGIPYQETASDFDRSIRPLFDPEELVDQVLVRLPLGLTQRCNEQLRAHERLGYRPLNRHGVYLSTTEQYGLLVTDMSNSSDPNTTVAEFKPKWLIQSPSAPAGAKRCRTCALREMKNEDACRKGLHEVRSFCPLDLVSNRLDDVMRAARFFRGRADHARVARAIYRHPTILKLRHLQQEQNDVGLKGPPENSSRRSLAMTFRDCTVFVKVRSSQAPNLHRALLIVPIVAAGRYGTGRGAPRGPRYQNSRQGQGAILAVHRAASDQ